MTARVETAAPLAGSSSRVLPVLRALSIAAAAWLARWREDRSALVMSDEWLQEFRASRER